MNSPVELDRPLTMYSGQPPAEQPNVRYQRLPTFARQIRATATSLLLTFSPQRKRQVVAGPESQRPARSRGTNQLKDVAAHVVFAPSSAHTDRHATVVGSSRVRIAGSLESRSKYKQGLEVRWHVNPELLTRSPKRAQADRLVDQRIRRRK